MPKITLVECRFDEAAWDLLKRIDIIAAQRNKLEDALYALWSNPASETTRDGAARLLGVGPYEKLEF